jgi:hypothetical protein
VKFPELFQKWLKKLSRVGQNHTKWEPSRYSRVCSLHFEDDDFIADSLDSREGRKQARGTPKLTKQRLREDAYPKQYLTEDGTPQPLMQQHITPTKRKADNLAQNRRDRVGRNWDVQWEQRQAEELLTEDLGALEDLLRSEPNVPAGFSISR